MKELYLDNNNISIIEGLKENTNLRVLSICANQIKVIENLEGIYLTKLFSKNN